VKRLLLFVILLLVVCAAGAAWFYMGVNRPYKGYAETEQFVEVPQGVGTAAIGRRLVDAGVVRDVNTFRLALWMTGQGRHLQAGEYRFDRPMSAQQVAEKIGRGEVYVHPITFREGLTIKQMAELIIKMTGSKSRIIYKPLPTDDPKVRQPDITRARTLLGWEPKVPLEEGLGTTIEYFRQKAKGS